MKNGLKLDRWKLATGFQAGDGEYYVTFKIDGHLEHWPLRSRESYQLWRRMYYLDTGKHGSIRIINAELDYLNFSNKKHDVHVRMAKANGSVYIDIGNSKWEQIQINKNGWSVISNLGSPVKFKRPGGLQELPYPERGGSLNTLKSFLNIDSKDHEWIMLVSWLVGSMQPEGPFPILFIHGEQGTAKSTAAKILRSIVDPSYIALRTPSRSERDLAIAADNSWILSFDNVSRLSPWLSDAICRISTEGGFATRQLWKNGTEKQFKSKRPVIFNGITSLAERHDLADRALIIELPPIPAENRRLEREIWEQLSIERPKILGALYDAVSMALLTIGQISLNDNFRMADFASWVSAAEPGIPWEGGTFTKEYGKNRSQVNDVAMESDLVLMSIIELMSSCSKWSGTATELLQVLEALLPAGINKSGAWPKLPHFLSGRIKRAATLLRGKGIEVEWVKSGTRSIKIKKVAD